MSFESIATVALSSTAVEAPERMRMRGLVTE